jgi:hypothetical protein
VLAAVMVGLVPEPLPAGAIGLMGGPHRGTRPALQRGANAGSLLPRAGWGSTLGLGYAVMLADLVLAPLTPSNSAQRGNRLTRGPGIPPLYGSLPGESARKSAPTSCGRPSPQRG